MSFCFALILKRKTLLCVYAAYASLFVIKLIGQDLLLVVTVFILPVYLKSLLSITETAIFLMAIEAAAVFLQKK